MAKQCHPERRRRANQFLLPSGHLITERPILFQTDMVQAVLDERKTQTRRMKGLESINVDPEFWNRKGDPRKNTCRLWDSTKESNPNPIAIHFGFRDPIDCIEYVKSPYGKPGDLLWVKETWATIGTNSVCFKAGMKPGLFTDRMRSAYKSSLHLRKADSRIWLMVEEIRVERLQDISEKDAKAEGVKSRIVAPINAFSNPFETFFDYIKVMFPSFGKITAKSSFQSLWKVINGEESWEANPWVWVVKFRVLSMTGKPSMEEIESNYQDLIASAKGRSLSSEQAGNLTDETAAARTSPYATAHRRSDVPKNGKEASHD